MTIYGDEGGHFACKLPPGACHCPQDIRHFCKFGVWVRAHDGAASERYRAEVARINRATDAEINSTHSIGIRDEK